MILSEFAGASQSLAGSLIINPWDVDQTAKAIHSALTLSAETRAQNWTKLFACISFTAQSWGLSFLNELNRSTGHAPAGPVLAGRRKSGASLSRTSSKASIKRRYTLNSSTPAKTET
ncbi:hypothetical protein VHUM_02186 [Vanrija humicola]|uniref:Uncharacterized protein n=1 Tax=Vanrija humicola TaxID=5417 RepID=A0A7D8Z3L3_VANHU|nr:hypothetical protein VHUM_02186 [Vanrija humicola]